MKYIPGLILMVALAACNGTLSTTQTTDSIPPPVTQVDTTATQKPAANKMIEVDSAMERQLAWADTLVRAWIKDSKNETVQNYVKDSSIVFMWDQIRTTDTATYAIAHLGSDVNNGAGTVFATAAWLYIDTLSHRVYEYDIAGDSLIKGQRQ